MPAFRTVFYYRDRVIIFRRWFVMLAFVSEGFLRKHLSAHRHYKITLHHVTSRSINTICDSWKKSEYQRREQ